MPGEQRTCKKCGHECHCDEINCPKCANDVCGFCDCFDDSMIGTDARSWPIMDVRIEQTD